MIDNEKFIRQLILQHGSDKATMAHVQTTVTAICGVLRATSRYTAKPEFDQIAAGLKEKFYEILEKEYLDQDLVSSNV